MKRAPWLEYDAGVSLGEYDGEMRVHADDAGNLWLLAWREIGESGEMRRDESYDGGLGGPQIEALRVYLNERAASHCTLCGQSLDPAFEWPAGAHDSCPREVSK